MTVPPNISLRYRPVQQNPTTRRDPKSQFAPRRLPTSTSSPTARHAAQTSVLARQGPVLPGSGLVSHHRPQVRQVAAW